MIEIRDITNPERLLGTLVRRPSAELRGHCIVMAVYDRVSAQMFDPYADCIHDTVRRVQFHVSFRSKDDGWTRVAEFHTSDRLQDLMLIPDFRLPGETEGQAVMRRYHS